MPPTAIATPTRGASPERVRRAGFPAALRATALAAGVASLPAHAASAADSTAEWLPWLVLGGVALFVVGLLVRMMLAARFPKGYRAWARSRRDAFAKRNEAFDRADEEFRK